MERVRGRGVSVASRPSTRASNLPVPQLVFVARGVFPRSRPCVCALRGFLPGRIFPDRTTRRHGLARLPPDWGGLAGRAVTLLASISWALWRPAGFGKPAAIMAPSTATTIAVEPLRLLNSTMEVPETTALSVYL